ncbi:flagellar hook capping FlgD N-terminal domain-containing protein [Oscillospiraceae bacterium PP1C4]
MPEVTNSYRDNYSGAVSSTGKNFNAVFTDEKNKSVSVDDFLNLMVAQLKNQNFMNPVDDTQYVSQLAQFATMQQMQDLAAYSKSNYATSLVGKDVTVAKYNTSGGVEKATGPVEKISLVNNEYTLYVKGKPYTLEQIMEINKPADIAPDKGSQVDPSSLTVEIQNVTADSVDLSWPVPTQDSSIADKLTYSAYYSTDSNLDTVSEVEENGILIGKAERTDLTSESLKGLKPDTTYYANVVVKDASGIKTIYQKSTFRTASNSEEV